MLYTRRDFEIINNFSTPSILTDDELELILAYLQGMVNLWCVATSLFRQGILLGARIIIGAVHH